MATKDVVSGLVTPIVIVTSALSYAALIFSGPFADALPMGISYALVSAGLMVLVFALFSRMPFAIAGPDSKPVAVLATMATTMAGVLAQRGSAADAGMTLLLVLIAGTLITGVVLFLLGVFKMGRWIRFVPYPVIGGFMAASGWFLTVGGLRVLAGSPLTWDLLRQFPAGLHLPQLVVGVGLAAAIHFVRRIKSPLVFPGLLVGGAVAIHVVLLAAGYSIAEARAAGWLFDLGSGVQWPGPALLSSLATVDPMIFLRESGDYVALATVTAMTLLLSLIAIEVEARLDLDLDYELRLNGLANVLVGLAGGMVGTLSVSRTLFNYRAGARERLSGILAGAVCITVLAFGTKALGFIPVPIIGALLLQLGTDMLNDWLIATRRTLQLPDYIQVLVIFVVIIASDFVAGLVVGILTACVTFALNTSRIRLVKLGLDRSNYGSRVDRPSYQQEALVRHGNGIQIVWLHGFIFFGSAHRLLQYLKDMVAEQKGACRSIILDFRQVLGIDSSAALSLIKLHQFAEREGFVIVFSELPSNVERALRASGALRADDPLCQVFPNLDSALEWCEDRVLDEVMSREEALRSTDAWLAHEIGGQNLFTRLVSYLEVVEYQPGANVFGQGEAADSLYLLYTGRVTILYHTPAGAELRLRSMVGHTVVGEMGLYRAMLRGASVRVDKATVAYRLSRDAIDQMEHDDPALACAFHKFIVRMLAARVDFANREVAGLQR